MKILRTLGLTVILAGIASAAVIENGTITITGPFDGSFNFEGSGFSASGVIGPEAGNWGVLKCFSIFDFCAPGSILDVNGTQSGSDFGFGSATIGATNFPGLNWGDLLS